MLADMQRVRGFGRQEADKATSGRNELRPIRAVVCMEEHGEHGLTFRADLHRTGGESLFP